jgi:ribosomal protein S18 acetylase RimI-like enzyme
MTHRPYRPHDDFAAMRRVLVESYARTGAPRDWLFCRLEDWRFGGNSLREASDTSWFDDTARLWFDSERRLLGFWISEYGNSAFTIETLPGRLDVERAILQWVVEAWAPGFPSVRTVASPEDRPRAALLEAFGFAHAGPGQVMREYDLARARSAPSLPAGYRIQPLAEGDEPGELVEVVNAAFEQQLTEHWYHSIMRAPSAAPEWWLTVRAPDGAYAAFCQAWIDSENGIAEIDPVGTHPAHQRRGLARAILVETFRRLHGAGVRLAYIDSSPSRPIAGRLYESLGPERRFERATYRYPRVMRR